MKSTTILYMNKKDYLNLTEENTCKRYQWQNERSIVWQRLQAAIIQMFKQLIGNHIETNEKKKNNSLHKRNRSYRDKLNRKFRTENIEWGRRRRSSEEETAHLLTEWVCQQNEIRE